MHKACFCLYAQELFLENSEPFGVLGIEPELATSKANILPTYILSLAPLTTSLMSCPVIGIFVHSISGIAGLGVWVIEDLRVGIRFTSKAFIILAFFVLHTPSRA